jgi:hypothetical protein
MKKQRIYIDTSVIGGCCDKEFEEYSNGLMQDFKFGNFKAVISEIVEVEIKPAPEEVLKIYEELLITEPEIIQIDEEVLELFEAYKKANILSVNFQNDLMHIALATIAEVDILTSWNFKHIVRFDKIRLYNGINIELGYKPIQIFSPREVTTYGKDN